MSNPAFKDVRNLKKNSITTTFLNLDKQNQKNDASKSQNNINPQKDGYIGQNKIKDFDNKLEQHKSQIQKNSSIIAELSNGLLMVKEQLLKQTQKYEQEQKKNKQLKDQIEKNNRVLKNRSQKLEQAQKKLDYVQKQLAIAKPAIEKNNQLNNKLTALTKKTAQLQKSLSDSESDKRNIINDKDYQIQQLKNSLSLLEVKYGESQQLKSSVNQKQKQLSYLKNQHQILAKNLQKQRRASIQLLQNNASLQSKLNSLLDQNKSKETLLAELSSLKTQYNNMKKKANELDQLKSHLQKTQEFLRKKNYEELSAKYHSSYEQNSVEIRKLQEDVRERNFKIKHLHEQIQSLKEQTYSMANDIDESSKASKQLASIKQRSSKLQVLYKQLLPPLKCSLCTKQFQKPVTIIPCGHNYCLGCKRGYNKTCLTCGPDLKIEAVYRNQLLDDMVKVVRDIKQLLTLIN